MKLWKKTWIGVVAVVLVLSLAACGGKTASTDGSAATDGGAAQSADGSDSQSGAADAGAQQKVTLEYWHTYSDQEEKILKEKIKPMFEKEHPEIELKLTRMPYDGLKQQVISAVAGDAAPDLMRMDIVWVPEFASQGALLKLDDMDGFSDVKGSVFEGPLSTTAYKGAYYGVPLNTNTKVAIYNKSVLQEAGLSEPPKTMDELVQAAKTLKAKNKFGIGISGANTWSMLPYFWSLGGKLTNDDYTQAEGFMNSPESVKALQTIADWNKQGLIIPPILGGEPGTWDGLKSGKYLMIDDGPWFYSILMNDPNNKFDVMNETVRAPIPAGPAGSDSVVGGEDLVVFAGSKHPKEAWTFAKWMLGEEPQKAMAEAGLIPTNKNAANAMKDMNIPFAAEYVKQMETALPRTPIPQWGEMETIWNLAVEKAVRGKADAKTALDEAAKQAQALLK